MSGQNGSTTSRHHHKKLEKQAPSKITLADIAIGFLREQTAIDTIVVGLTNKEELVQLASAFDRGAEKLNFIWKNWEVHDEILLDPRSGLNNFIARLIYTTCKSNAN